MAWRKLEASLSSSISQYDKWIIRNQETNYLIVGFGDSYDLGILGDKAALDSYAMRVLF
jgi:hypothetical protein